MTPVYRPDGELAYMARASQLEQLERADRIRVEYRANGKPKRAILRARPGDASPITLGSYGTRYSFYERLETGAGVWTLKPSHSIRGAAQ